MKIIVMCFVLAAFSFAACNSSGEKGNASAPNALANTKTEFKVGMHCTDCEKAITKSVNKLEGIATVKASFKDSTALVSFDSTKVKESAIVLAIQDAGYKVDTFMRR